MIEKFIHKLYLIFYMTVALLSIAMVIEVGTWFGALSQGVASVQVMESLAHLTVLLVLMGIVITIFRPTVRGLEAKHKAVALREAHLNRVMTTSVVGYAVIHPKTYKYIEVNNALCSMLGYEKEEMLGNTPLDFCMPESEKVFRAQSSTIEQTDDRQYQIVMRHKDGHPVYTQYNANTVWNQDGQAELAFSFVTDITNIKNTQKALREAKDVAEEATALKDQFVSLVAHDLRNPIGAIRGFTEMMILDTKDPLNEKQKEYMSHVFSQSNELLELINDLLDISKLQSGMVDVEALFFDAHYMVDNIAHRLKLQASKKGITIVNDVSENTRVYADETLFGQVVQNLISNAIKFSHEDSEVRIFAEDGDVTRIGVQDQGVGIAKGAIEKLFHMEEKTSTHGTAGEAGTGFGLPLSRQIMQVHEGDISVESEEGKGSTFYASLPKVVPEILVVDDDPSICALLKQLLTLEGAHVQEAYSAKEAIEYIQRSGIPHLVITDINMPEMDGLEMIRKLKIILEDDLMPIIVLTAVDGEKASHQCLALGALDFSQKPIVINDFMLRVKRFIG
ncbi:MAG: response regulator [Magnetovibrio sp.]|nr:response regulator [Magnetovibrio sp.]